MINSERYNQHYRDLDLINESGKPKMKIDPARLSSEPETGIFVRAQDDKGHWLSVDIAHLDKASLLEWLQSRGGNNPLAENTVCILLGHGSVEGS
jgi:hypothetical protein